MAGVILVDSSVWIYFFNGTRKGYAFPRAIGIFSNVAWRLLLLQLWSRKYLAA